MQPRRVVQTRVDARGVLNEFLLEGDEDFITKEVALRMAEAGEIDAQVIRPKNRDAYLRDRPDKNKADNFLEIVVRSTCGPEIGPKLRQALFAAKQKFEGNEWSRERKANACDYLTRAFMDSSGMNLASAWDIQQLYEGNEALAREPGSPADEFLSDYPKCATSPDCKRTVMVYGNCHKSGIVNYVLFGWLWKLCATGYPLEILKKTSGYIQWINDFTPAYLLLHPNTDLSAREYRKIRGIGYLFFLIILLSL